MYSPPEDGSAGGGSYPRVIQVEHFAGMEGDLLVTCARRPSMPIFRSTDEGETWEQVSETEGLSGQPALYELPQTGGGNFSGQRPTSPGPRIQRRMEH